MKNKRNKIIITVLLFLIIFWTMCLLALFLVSINTFNFSESGQLGPTSVGVSRIQLYIPPRVSIETNSINTPIPNIETVFNVPGGQIKTTMPNPVITKVRPNVYIISPDLNK